VEVDSAARSPRVSKSPEKITLTMTTTPRTSRFSHTLWLMLELLNRNLLFGAETAQRQPLVAVGQGTTRRKPDGTLPPAEASCP
jgi:hypothetical protein